MIKGLGIDIVENKRIKITSQFIDKILSKKEKELLNRMQINKQKREFLAGRWAVKEALFKASIDVYPLPLIAVLQNQNNKLIIEINNKIQSNIFVSLSHEKKLTVGVVLIN